MNPEDPAAGTRRVPFSRTIFIEQRRLPRGAAAEVPPAVPRKRGPAARRVPRHVHGRRQGRRAARSSSCAAPTIPPSRGGSSPDGRKVKSTHPLDLGGALGRPRRCGCTSRCSPRRTRTTRATADWRAQLNPESLVTVVGARVARSDRGASGRDDRAVRAAGLLLRGRGLAARRSRVQPDDHPEGRVGQGRETGGCRVSVRRASASGSRRARPASFTSAARAPRSSTGSTRGATAASFVLRIEDTDAQRSSEEVVRAILDGMAWLGMSPDEGPFFQIGKPRAARRRRAAAPRRRQGVSLLLRRPRRLSAEREAAEKAGGGYVYPRRCLAIPRAESRRARRGAARRSSCACRCPPGVTAWDDGVHGPTSFDNAVIEDLILLRIGRDARPTTSRSSRTTSRCASRT